MGSADAVCIHRITVPSYGEGWKKAVTKRYIVRVVTPSAFLPLRRR